MFLYKIVMVSINVVIKPFSQQEHINHDIKDNFKINYNVNLRAISLGTEISGYLGG